jgi:hypothetical protein
MRIGFQSGRGARMLLAGVGIAFGLSGPLLAQEAAKDADKAREAKTPAEKVEGEGLIQRREEYRALRRRGPADPNFNAAAARLKAFEQMRAQRAAAVNPADGHAATSNPNIWENVGPGPINNAQTPPNFTLPSDVSGRVTAIAIDATDNAVYVGGAQGGVWKSLDNGATWTAISDSLGSLAVGAIAIDPAPHAAGAATIYLGTGEGNGSCDSYGGVGVYKSTNSGASWSAALGAAQFTNRGITSLAVDRLNPLHILATTGSGFYSPACITALTLPTRGVYASNDGGATWAKVSEAINERASKVIQDPVTPTVWWAAMWMTGATAPAGPQDGGLLKSTNNGASFTQVAGTGGLTALSGPNLNRWQRAYVTATVNNPVTPTQSVLYVGFEYITQASAVSGAFTNGGTVFKSIDSGATWTAVPAANGFCGGQCYYDMPIHVEPGDPSRVYVGGAGQTGALPTLFMRSDNGGTSFADKTSSPGTGTGLHADMHFITTWPGQPNRLWVGNDGGVWRSDDRGNTWINVNNGLQITQFTAGDMHPTDPGTLYAGSQDNGTEGWQGSINWKHLDFGDGGFAQIDKNNPNNLVHTYFNQYDPSDPVNNSLIGVGFTTGGFATTMGGYGGSFAPQNGIALEDVLFYAPIHLDRGANPATLYYGTYHLWRAPNFFATAGGVNEFSSVGTTDLAPGNAGLGIGSGVLSAIETFANGTGNANVIYTGSTSGNVFMTTNATAATPTWTEVDTGAAAGQYVSSIVIDRTNSSVVYVARAGFQGAPGLNIRKTVNNGVNWSNAASGIPDVPVNALVQDPVTPNTIWAGTDIGVYVSTNGGGTWTPANQGMPAVAVFDLKANTTTKQIVAFTHGRSAYMRSVDSDIIFRDGVEGRDTSHWTTTVNNAGLAVNGTAAMASTTRGIQVTANGTLSQYVQDDSPTVEPRYRVRFYFNPNSFDTGEAQGHHRTRIFIGFNGGGQRAIALVLRRQGGVYAIEGRIRQNDGSRVDSGFVTISNAAHFIEFDWVKSGVGLGNGSFNVSVDGASVSSTGNVILNDAQTIESGRLGGLSIKTGAAGSMFFDQFLSRRVFPCGPES